MGCLVSPRNCSPFSRIEVLGPKTGDRRPGIVALGSSPWDRRPGIVALGSSPRARRLELAASECVRRSRIALAGIARRGWHEGPAAIDSRGQRRFNAASGGYKLMALVPFGRPRKSSKYHGASGPNSPGRMPQHSEGAEQKTAHPRSKPFAAPVVEEVTPRRVREVDSDPNAAQRGQNPRRRSLKY